MIKVFNISGQEITVIQSTITISKENNAFSSDFSVYYNKYPFLIAEDKVTSSSFGNRSLLTIGRNKEFNIIVQFSNQTYAGKITILGLLVGSRKCNIRFGSELLNITGTSLDSFFDNHYFGSQIEYTETTDVILEQDNLIAAIEDHTKKNYPEVLFNFPTILVPDYHTGNDNYASFASPGINYRFTFSDASISKNEYRVNYLNFYSVNNTDTIAPFLYLKGLVEEPLKEIGWSLEGDFKEDEFNSKIGIIPKINNNTLFPVNSGYEISFEDFGGFYTVLENSPYKAYDIQFSELKESSYTLKIDFKQITKSLIGDVTINFSIDGETTINVINFDDSFTNKTDTSVSFSFEVTEENSNSFIYITYVHPYGLDPEETTILLVDENYEETNISFFHPTINLKRYVPEWSYLELLNNLKNLLNLKIDIDEQRKILSLNYNAAYISNFDYVDLTNYPIRVTSEKNNEIIEYGIAYANTNLDSDDEIETISNAFKIDFSTKEKLEAEGINIALCDDGISLINTYQNKSLSLENETGSLYSNLWSDWHFFLNNTSVIEAEAYLPETIIFQIEEKLKIYFNCIQFAVTKIDYLPSNERLKKVKLSLNNILKNGSLNSTTLINDLEKEINLNFVDLIPGIYIPSYYQFKLSYDLNFTSFLGTAYVKKLTQAPSLGIVYSNIEEVLDGITSLSEATVIPLSISDYNGWYEIYIQDTDGTVSNKIYKEILIDDVDNSKKIKLNVIFEADYYLTTLKKIIISFIDIDPDTLVFTLQAVSPDADNITIGEPIEIIITDFTKEYHEIDLPDETKKYRLIAKTEDGIYDSEYIYMVSSLDLL